MNTNSRVWQRATVCTILSQSWLLNTLKEGRGILWQYQPEIPVLLMKYYSPISTVTSTRLCVFLNTAVLIANKMNAIREINTAIQVEILPVELYSTSHCLAISLLSKKCHRCIYIIGSKHHIPSCISSSYIFSVAYIPFTLKVRL